MGLWDPQNRDLRAGVLISGFRQKNRGRKSHVYIYSTLLVFSSVTHMPPSRTASLAILVHKRSQFSDISKSQKSEHDTRSGLSRPHSLVPQTMYWSQTESSKCSLENRLHEPRRPRNIYEAPLVIAPIQDTRVCHLRVTTSGITSSASPPPPPKHANSLYVFVYSTV